MSVPVASPLPAAAPSAPLELLSRSELAAWSLSTSAWRYEAWLQSYPLNAQTVLDYFKHSPYYDLSANNERLSSTTAPSSLQLRQLEGVEYEVDASRAAAAADSVFFLIRKQHRISPSSARLLSLYHVIGSDPPQSSASSSSLPLPRGSVIPLPAIAAVCRCAVDAALAAVNTAMQAHHSNWYSKEQKQLTAVEQKHCSDEDDGQLEDVLSSGAAVTRPAAAVAAAAAAVPASARPSTYAQLADDALRRLLMSAGGGQRAQ